MRRKVLRYQYLFLLSERYVEQTAAYRQRQTVSLFQWFLSHVSEKRPLSRVFQDTDRQQVYPAFQNIRLSL